MKLPYRPIHLVCRYTQDPQPYHDKLTDCSIRPVSGVCGPATLSPWDFDLDRRSCMEPLLGSLSTNKLLPLPTTPS